MLSTILVIGYVEGRVSRIEAGAPFRMPEVEGLESQGIDSALREKVLCEILVSDTFLRSTAKRTTYCTATRGMKQKEATINEFFHFLSILYYLGIVKDADKDDLWPLCNIQPSHPICDGMYRERF